jgi:hypothetical protein
MSRKLIDLTGKQFGRLTVLHREGNYISPGGQAHPQWVCQCECGTTTLVVGQRLRNGRTKSCGCAITDGASNIPPKKMSYHGMEGTVEYACWASMRGRCRNPKDANYANYGGKGVTVCERWDEFENFYADMGPRPAGTSIDRIDPHGNYEPGNCRWTTKVVQAYNKRRYGTRNSDPSKPIVHACMDWTIMQVSSKKNKYVAFDAEGKMLDWSVSRTLTDCYNKAKRKQEQLKYGVTRQRLHQKKQATEQKAAALTEQWLRLGMMLVVMVMGMASGASAQESMKWPNVIYSGAAAADYITTYRAMGYPGIEERNPLSISKTNRTVVVAQGVAVDAFVLWGANKWIAPKHPKVAKVALVGVAAVRFWLAASNHKEVQRYRCNYINSNVC